MEEINSPKKERKFLKAVGNVAGILIQEFVLGLGRKFIGKKLDKIGNKRQALLIFLALFCNIAWASVDSIPYPITPNKQRLGWQTTGNGLVYRGLASDTITKPSNYANKDIKAYLLLDTVNNVMYSYIASKGGWKFNNSDTVIIQGATMPFDSITFNTANDGTVGVGEVEYNDTQGSLIQGLKGGNVTNVIGQQLHQRVNNRTGATLNKGDVVYLSGSQGNRITVAKAIATSDPTSANTFGIVAESIADNQSGYVITEGLITGLNTSALTQDSAVYLSGITAGALTSTKPQAPIHGVYVGVCVKSNAGSGELFCKIRNGLELDELHDLQITSPVDKASLYYKSDDGLWRDTTAALLVSDTASMLTPYFRDADTTSLNLTSRFAAKLNLSDTASMLTNYLRTGVAASTYLTQSNAASTYLPLTGGTLTGGLNGTTGTFNTRLGVGSFAGSPLLFASGTGNQEVHFAHSQNIAGATITLRLTNTNAGFYDQGTYLQSIVERGINEMSGALGTNGSEYIRLRGVDDGGVVGVGIFNTNPSYNLDLTGTFRATSNSLIGGTLGVTGFSTFSTGAVINENSNDSDTRIESDGNANMVFVDASTDRVGIGTNAPTKTLDVNGEVKIATTTATPTVLLGKDGSNVVGQLYIDGGLSIIGSNLYGIKPSYSSITGTSATYSSDYMNTVNALYIKVNNNSTVTITLPSATSQNGKSITVKNLGTGAVNSNSNNVEPFNSTSLGTSILSSGGGKWATLVSDGTNWVIMQAN